MEKVKETHALSGAQWIGGNADCQCPVLIRRFAAHAGDKATLFITGLGYFEATVNGKPVTDARLLPLVTDYEPRDTASMLYPIHDTFTHRVYYCRFDITTLLCDGENRLEIRLGNGFYRQTERIAEGNCSYGNCLKAIFRILLPDGEVLSDGSETWHSDAVVYNNLFFGEVEDRTLPTQPEQPVQLLAAPQAELCEQIGAPDRVIRTIQPVCCGTFNGHTVYDVGENITGVVRVHTHAQCGKRIILRFAENRNEDGSLNFNSTGGCANSGNHIASGRLQIMQDEFICDGQKDVFEPKFVWHAFRYFDVTGEIDAAEVLEIHSDVAVSSRFESMAEGLNFLYESYLRTQLNNMHGGFPSDCPHRERLGYTGDGQICCRAGMLLLDSREFYRKWIQDILDCQDTVGGHVQHTAPMMGGGGGPGGWSCAIVIVPYRYYRQYGDLALLRSCYQPMRFFISYLKRRLENGLITAEEPGGWCLGDWCTLKKCEIPEPYVNTYYFIKCLRYIREIAAALGETQDLPEYQQLENMLCEALVKTYRGGDGHFCSGVQGADAYAADLGFDRERLAASLARRYDALGHFDTGFIGTYVLLDVLFETGHADTAFSLLEGEQCGSYLYMKRHGATTIWEAWQGWSSHDHPMFGGGAYHLLNSILGITQEADSAGFAAPLIAPQIPAGLSSASGSVMTPRGEIFVSFTKSENVVDFAVTLPDKVSARFIYGTLDTVLDSGSQRLKYNI